LFKFSFTLSQINPFSKFRVNSEFIEPLLKNKSPLRL